MPSPRASMQQGCLESRVDPDERLSVKREDDHFWRAEVKVGFMEHPDIPEILASLRAKGAEMTS